MYLEINFTSQCKKANLFLTKNLPQLGESMFTDIMTLMLNAFDRVSQNKFQILITEKEIEVEGHCKN